MSTLPPRLCPILAITLLATPPPNSVTCIQEGCTWWAGYTCAVTSLTHQLQDIATIYTGERQLLNYLQSHPPTHPPPAEDWEGRAG